MNVKGIFSHDSDLWATPTGIYQFFKGLRFFDPCPSNPTFDGLAVPWSCSAFVNPPYSDIKSWVSKAIKECMQLNNNCTYVFLVPARVETNWFCKLWDYGADFIFLRSRLRFSDSKVPAPFPSMFVVLTGNASQCFSMSLVDFFDFFTTRYDVAYS